MAVGFPKGMPVFYCDGDSCPHVFHGPRFRTSESAKFAREAGWAITEITPRDWRAHCGRCALLLEQAQG